MKFAGPLKSKHQTTLSARLQLKSTSVDKYDLNRFHMTEKITFTNESPFLTTRDSIKTLQSNFLASQKEALSGLYEI